jgi:hypothetical protein
MYRFCDIEIRDMYRFCEIGNVSHDFSCPMIESDELFDSFVINDYSFRRKNRDKG